MKTISNKKQSLSSKRTLNLLIEALRNLLKEKSFENITVQELCNKSLIARGTFYNYFEDKYELLNYFWYTLTLLIDPVPIEDTNETIPYDILGYEQYLELFIEKYITFFDLNVDSLNSIIKHNSLSGYLVHSCRIYLNEYIVSKIKLCNGSIKFSIPYELVAQYYTNSILTILEWRYIHKNETSKEELIKYLRVLIKKSDLILN